MVIFQVRSWSLRLFNSSKVIDANSNIGKKLEAYYDEKAKRWIFPGDEVSGSAHRPHRLTPVANTAIPVSAFIAVPSSMLVFSLLPHYRTMEVLNRN